jgi:hypothetical protein
LRGLLDGVRGLIEERLARPDALARLTLTPAAAATLIITTTRGMVVMERVYSDRAQVEAVAEDLLRVLLPDKLPVGRATPPAPDRSTRQ